VNHTDTHIKSSVYLSTHHFVINNPTLTHLTWDVLLVSFCPEGFVGIGVQECVINFANNVLLLESTSMTEQNVVINIWESSGLAKSEELIEDKVILNRV
jgi:hypothetical protein